MNKKEEKTKLFKVVIEEIEDVKKEVNSSYKLIIQDNIEEIINKHK